MPNTKNRTLCRVLALCAFLVSQSGCNTGSTGASGSKSKAAPVIPQKVIAQGQILPAGGLIRLGATPGDIVDVILPKVGDSVRSNDPLIEMRSLKLHQARVDSLRSRMEDAKRQKEHAIAQAQLALSTAAAKVQQARGMLEAVQRQKELLDLAKQQVAASEKLVLQLEKVANDPLTRSFVGTNQLEQQRLLRSEADLKYRQQVESQLQAEEAAALSSTAAEQEMSAARLALEVAEGSLAVSAIESELRVLEVQEGSSLVRAPRDAVVVAINARVGEAVSQLPVIELADISKVICETEVVELDAKLIQLGQQAIIRSPALPQELHGKVTKIGRLVGRPMLAVADPLAKSDYRSLNVIIEIDSVDAEIAARWLQLQVDVEVDVAADQGGSTKAAAAQP